VPLLLLFAIHTGLCILTLKGIPDGLPYSRMRSMIERDRPVQAGILKSYNKVHS